MAQANAGDLTQKYKSAMALQIKGETEPALSIYRELLDQNPKIAEVHFQIGRIMLAKFQLHDAVKFFQNAVLLKPAESAIWDQLTTAAAQLGDAKTSKNILKLLKTSGLPPQHKKTFRTRLENKAGKSKMIVGEQEKQTINTLVSLMNQGQFAKAELIATQALGKYPTTAVFALITATAQFRLGKIEPASAHFKRAITLNPKYAEAYNEFGNMLMETGKIELAIQQFQNALKYAPKMTAALLNLGTALIKDNRAVNAIEFLRRAQSLDPKNHQIASRLGMALGMNTEHEESSKQLQFAIEHGSNSPDVYVYLGTSLSELGKIEAARDAYNHALKLDPDFVLAEFRLGILEQIQGNFDIANTHIKRAMELDPDNAEFCLRYATSNKIDPSDPIFTRLKKIADDTEQPLDNRRSASFAITKILEDAKEYEQAFPYLKLANDLNLEIYPYDVAERVTYISQLQELFADFSVSDASVHGYTDAAPIFVTSMPRSGSTLVEQIIASHSQVTGVGEVGHAVTTARSLILREGGKFQPADKITPDEIHGMGEFIATKLSELAGDNNRVADKSIQTYTMMGLVQAALPKAKIVVVNRDPRDNLLSIYRNKFTDGTHSYAYDLHALGIYYNKFVDMVNFWRAKMPNQFYEIQYEDLIDNPEEETRKLIDFCDLEWEDACLNFHQSKREIKTLSVYQVRQPIYKSSMKAWQRYEAELKPMFDALKEGGNYPS
ncbi:hypothetical protein BFP76_08645 [Amylibacter kogurei]|uniref:Uncharacterized protein n=1 Tax=Paramylibacter kogurei TaxID=1889778 RepID=A0A2G5K0Y0_9RHOB|nr:tetratricopeptide repeat-containing sulfotransferase family protein [Amylibacter kogurei]PIB23085.1 hypothetical protein BFP76_08645 [Amylibacter kogurei]